MKSQERGIGKDVGTRSRKRERSGEGSDWFCEETWDVNQAVENWRG
jgi:hypothetical protein